MAFVDDVRIVAHAGKGGDGVVRWLRNKETARGGPSGGDGGRGGDVVLVGVRDIAALSYYRYEKRFKAENGEAGMNELRHGADGGDCELRVPIGTVATIEETGETVEVTSENERVVLFKGGRGGYGNAHFKSSTHQNPFEQTDGKPGGAGQVQLTLKLIAEIGLIGLPNAGKSSLLNAMTNAKSKVGNYPFTTLGPHLGDYFGHIIADIPGLIEGASTGRGLGTKFLKHVERTGILLHLVSAEQDDVARAYTEVRREVEQFGRGLADKSEVVILSKIDLISPEERETMVDQLRTATGREVVTVSISDTASLKGLGDRLVSLISSNATH